jgi:hypothetical protein
MGIRDFGGNVLVGSVLRTHLILADCFRSGRRAKACKDKACKASRLAKDCKPQIARRRQDKVKRGGESATCNARHRRSGGFVHDMAQDTRLEIAVIEIEKSRDVGVGQTVTCLRWGGGGVRPVRARARFGTNP